MPDTLKNFAVLRNGHDWTKYKAEVTRGLVGEVDITNEDVIQFPKPPKSYPCLVAAIVSGDGSKAASKYHMSCCYVYEKDAAKLLDICDEARKPETLPADSDDSDDDFYDDPDYVDDDLLDLESQVTGLMNSLNVNCAVISAMVLELADIGALKIAKLEERARAIHHENETNPCFNVVDYILDQASKDK